MLIISISFFEFRSGDLQHFIDTDHLAEDPRQRDREYFIERFFFLNTIIGLQDGHDLWV